MYFINPSSGLPESITISPTTSTVTGNNTYYSPTYTPTLPGTYQWVASYSGDTNNSPATTLQAGNTLLEQLALSGTVYASSLYTTPGSTPGSTTLNNIVVLGSGVQVTDTVTLSGYTSPWSQIQFTLTGPSPSTAVVDTYTVTASGNTSYTTSGYTPTAAGTYSGWSAPMGRPPVMTRKWKR